MKILIVGSGGREHALAWKCAQSEKVTDVFVAPGNAGTELEPKTKNVNAHSIAELVTFAKFEKIDLTIVGPETFLVNGIVDEFKKHRLHCFGPTAKAAQLEGSKAFAKEFLGRHNIPTAKYEKFTYEDLEPALQYVIDNGAPIVIKADGLLAGKGVIVGRTELEAKDAVVRFLQQGHDIVIEEFLAGEEVSYIVMTDGKSVLPLATSQDYKTRDDGDVGPNTGGMGAYSPAPIVTPELDYRIKTEIINPTFAGLKKDQIHYEGFLYVGLMIDETGAPKVLEFNCRLGDPETQPIMARLKNDIVDLCMLELAFQILVWDTRAAVGVVLASKGYPKNYVKGNVITGMPVDNTEQKVFHAGTALVGDELVTSGGRVLCAVGLGKTFSAAKDIAYAQAEQIQWNNQFYRRDIGDKAILLDK